jgi:hypothetical protein
MVSLMGEVRLFKHHIWFVETALCSSGMFNRRDSHRMCCTLQQWFESSYEAYSTSPVPWSLRFKCSSFIAVVFIFQCNPWAHWFICAILARVHRLCRKLLLAFSSTSEEEFLIAQYCVMCRYGMNASMCSRIVLKNNAYVTGMNALRLM